MHRVQQAIRVALYAATLATFVDVSLGDSRLPLMCKNIARDVIMNSCKGSRIKRAPVTLDPVKLDEELKMDASGDHTEHVMPQKRQGYFEDGPFGEYHSETQSNYHDIELQLPGVEFSDDRGNQFSENQFSPDFPVFPGDPGESFGLGGGFFRAGSEPVARSADSPDLLGYHLSPEELEELYQEIGERMPRNSKDFNKKIFLNVAAKCCPNVKLCYDNPSLIPCIVY